MKIFFFFFFFGVVNWPFNHAIIVTMLIIVLSDSLLWLSYLITLCRLVPFSPCFITVLIHSALYKLKAKLPNTKLTDISSVLEMGKTTTRFHSSYMHSGWVGVHLTDGHPDLNYIQVIQWEERHLITDGHVICIKPLWNPLLPVTYTFSLFRNVQCQNHSYKTTGI